MEHQQILTNKQGDELLNIPKNEYYLLQNYVLGDKDLDYINAKT